MPGAVANNGEASGAVSGKMESLVSCIRGVVSGAESLKVGPVVVRGTANGAMSSSRGPSSCAVGLL